MIENALIIIFSLFFGALGYTFGRKDSKDNELYLHEQIYNLRQSVESPNFAAQIQLADRQGFTREVRISHEDGITHAYQRSLGGQRITMWQRVSCSAHLMRKK